MNWLSWRGFEGLNAVHSYCKSNARKVLFMQGTKVDFPRMRKAQLASANMRFKLSVHQHSCNAPRSSKPGEGKCCHRQAECWTALGWVALIGNCIPNSRNQPQCTQSRSSAVADESCVNPEGGHQERSVFQGVHLDAIGSFKHFMPSHGWCLDAISAPGATDVDTGGEHQ